MLSARCGEARYQACSCLSELAFRDELNSLLIVNVPGALDAMIQLMMSSDMQEDAALIVGNCAAFSEEAVETMVHHAGLVAALKVAATSAEAGTKGIAVGAINCFSRFGFASDTLIAERVVEEALLPLLRRQDEKEEEEGGQPDAVELRAALAVANLTGLSRESFGSAAQFQRAVTTAVSILEGALDGRSWEGISFSAYSILFPLRNMALAARNREALVEAGLLELLARVVGAWRELPHKGGAALVLAVEAAGLLSGRCDWQQRLRQADAIPLLRALSDHAAAHPEAAEAAGPAGELVRLLEEGHVAVCMAQHGRLGAGSGLGLLDESLTQMVLAFTIGGRFAPPAAPSQS